MAKLIHILAASVGGGILFGASIRLGEALAPGKPGGEAEGSGGEGRRGRGEDPTLARLERIEARLARPGAGAEARGSAEQASGEWRGMLAGVAAKVERQQADVEVLRRQMAAAARAMESVTEMATGFRGEVQRQVGRELDERLAALEQRLHGEVERARGETVSAMLETIETRVTPRIGRLEGDIGTQTAALAELRDCSVQSERSIQRLLGVLEKVLQPGGEAPRLAVVPARGREEGGDGQDDGSAGSNAIRRPATFR